MGRRSMQIEGLEELTQQLGDAQNAAVPIGKASLYEGAKIVADAITSAMQAIQTEPFRYVPEGGEKRLPSPEEKAALLSSGAGVSQHRFDGSAVSVAVMTGGKSGYKQVAGRRVASQELFNSIENGTSFMVAQPVTRRAIAKARAAASAKVQAECDARAQKLLDSIK